MHLFFVVFCQCRFSAALEAHTIEAFEPCVLIGQYLNSWRVTFQKHTTCGMVYMAFDTLPFLNIIIILLIMCTCTCTSRKISSSPGSYTLVKCKCYTLVKLGMEAKAWVQRGNEHTVGSRLDRSVELPYK